MAVLRASPLPRQHLPSSSTSQSQRHPRGSIAAAALSRTSPHPPPLKIGCHGRANKTLLAGRGRLPVPCLPTKQEVGAVGGAQEERYLATVAGWGVRRMGRVGEEMRRVALVQAEAFHVPVALFNDFFFNFFKAEVLSALIYKLMRNSAPDRYACLVAEEAGDTTQLLQAPFEKIIGVVDCMVQDEGDILKNLQGVQEYFYVSGIAVLPSFRHQKARRSTGGAPPDASFGIYLPLTLETLEADFFLKNLLLFRRCRDFDLGRISPSLLRHPAGGRRPFRRLLHHHDRLPDDV